ncbi:capsular biosynthesis protein, partial [Vibrio parahaemolyticus]|nr:capsular biosynthesis protein [Vibrio parahaemolyticus]
AALNIVVLGRFALQKDPQFLLNTLRCLNRFALNRQLDLTWIGGGDRELEQSLRAEDVKVTGMLPRDEVVKKLQSSEH